MKHIQELHFFQEILENLHINTSLLQAPYENADIHDFGIRKIAYPNISYENYIKNFCNSCNDNILYKAYDEFLFNYFIMKLPSEDNICLLIGPFTLSTWSETTLLNIAQDFNITPEAYPDFRNCYHQVPLVTDSSMLTTLVNTFAAKIWGSMDAFSMKELQNFAIPSEDSEDSYIYDSNKLYHSIDFIENRFKAESEFMQIVSHGHLHKIEMYLHMINITTTETRLADRVRNAKNYAIIMNTLLRKAAEQGSVPLIHIDQTSSAFAKKIELQTSEEGISALIKEMARKYTLLVRNHSLHGYSKPIRKVLIHIDTDISADLSLRTQAKLLDINPSYLSTIFKKETGQTLTEYVNQKRIEHALFLLNSTNMQIQTVAQYCGVPDICYFTKLFKKIVGKTPTEYKFDIRH